MTIEISLALLALAAPLTAGILKFIPQRVDNAPPSLTNGSRYLTLREFDNFRNELRGDFRDLKSQVDEIKRLVDPLR